jgi:HlyD family secretion protein
MKLPHIFSQHACTRAAFICASLWLCKSASLDAAASPADTGTRVIVAQAAPACFSAAVKVTGYLVPRTPAIVNPGLDGYKVTEILAAEGEFVAEGQPLARLGRVGKTGNVGASAGLPAVIVLRAPAAGTIVKSTARIGGAASVSAEPLFQLAVSGIIEVDAEVSSIYLAEIKEDQSVHVVTMGGREINGKVRKVGSEIDPVTQMGHVRVAINPEPPLRAGGFVRATIDGKQSCGISVPRSAVLYKTDGTSVQVVRGRTIETVRVRVGLLSGRDAEIQEGLLGGELIVAHAGTSLRDGDEVTPVIGEEAGQAAGRN